MMKNKKKIITIISIVVLVILLCVGINASLKSYYLAKLNEVSKLHSIMNLFNFEVIDGDGNIISEPPTIKEEARKFEVVPSLYFNYIWKSVSGQDITYKDFMPDAALKPSEKNPMAPNTKSTEECVKNFNDNMLKNPYYSEYKHLYYECLGDTTLTVDYLLNVPTEMSELISKLREAMTNSGLSVDNMTDNTYNP